MKIQTFLWHILERGYEGEEKTGKRRFNVRQAALGVFILGCTIAFGTKVETGLLTTFAGMVGAFCGMWTLTGALELEFTGYDVRKPPVGRQRESYWFARDGFVPGCLLPLIAAISFTVVF